MSCSLITGGFGFLGCYLARQLIGEGENPVLFDIATDSKLLDGVRGRFKAVRGDVTNLAQLFEVIKTNGVSTIYHLAASMIPQSEENLMKTYLVNVTGTMNILEAARIMDVADVICISSSSTFGSVEQGTADEDTPQRPRHMYSATKVCAERLGEEYQRKYGVNFRAVRFPPIIGAGRAPGQPSFFTCQMIIEPALGRPCSVNITPETSTAAVYVKDAARSLVCLKQGSEKRLKRRVYNIQGFSLSAKGLAEVILGHIPHARIDFVADRGLVDYMKGTPKRMDDTRAREDWDWEPHYDIPKAVQDFIAEMKANPALHA